MVRNCTMDRYRQRLSQSVFLFAMVKHHDQSNLGRKGLFHHIAHHPEKTEQDPGGRSWCRGHGGVLLIGLLPMACSACFVIEPRTTSPGMAPPTVVWVSAINHQSRKYSIGQSFEGIFSIEGPFSKMSLACATLT